MEPSGELCQKRNQLYTASTYYETAISPLYHILILFSFQRNAWHISGGEGAAANSANRRVLVTRPDGSQYVEEIKNDLVTNTLLLAEFAAAPSPPLICQAFLGKENKIRI